MPSMDKGLVEAIDMVNEKTGMSYRQMADAAFVSPSYLSKAKNGAREWDEELDEHLSRLDHRIALNRAEKHSAGMVKSVYGIMPEYDEHPEAERTEALTQAREAFETVARLRFHAHRQSTPEEAEEAYYQWIDMIVFGLPFADRLKKRTGKTDKQLDDQYRLRLKEGSY